MNKSDREALLTLGGLALLGWLLSRKKKGKCPKCNYPVMDKEQQCPNCGQWLDWGHFK